MSQERKTYRATKGGLCFCGRHIDRGQPIQYVETASLPKTGARFKGQAGRTQAAHKWCSENLLPVS